MVDYTNVSARAMLVDLHVSIWSAQRFNRDVSDEVAERKRADRYSGRYNVHLFGTRRAGRKIAPEFSAVHDAADALYQFHIANTLPFGGNGERLLSTANYFAYTDGVRQRGTSLERAADAFAQAYPQLKQEAEARLGELYRPDDFLPDDEVRQRFGWSVEFKPVPASGDIRVDLPADEVAKIEQQIAVRVEGTVREAMQEAWDRLRHSVERIRSAAGTSESGRAGTVRDTLIESVRETCEILGRLNVAQDERLDDLRRRVEHDLTSIAVEDLRKDDRLRADTELKAADIIAQMSAFYQPTTPATA